MNFLNPPDQYQDESSLFHIIPAPYEGATSRGTGQRHGPEAVLRASQNLSYYDHRTGAEPYKHGVRTHEDHASHEDIHNAATRHASLPSIPVFIGGDHSITIPTTQGLPQDTDAVILDAHADMHYKWNGEKHNHACVTRHVSTDRHVVIDGVRSMSKDEHRAAQQTKAVSLTTPRETVSFDHLSDTVHLSIDIDVLDPSIISQTGTPEPNGYSYDNILTIIERLLADHDIVSVDIVEFTPCDDEPARQQAEAHTVASLIHDVLAMITNTQKHGRSKEHHG
jgi:agmatinase